jgi:Uma2 family endonuclease
MATVQTRIGPADHGRRLTLAEFLDAEETPGYRYELARGVIEVSDIPDDVHGLIVHILHEAFSLYNQTHPRRVWRIGHGSDLQIVIPKFGKDTDRHPDLGIVFVGKAPDADGRRMPDLVVEVVSPGKAARDRDYVAKREDYLNFGILEYWIVDRFERKVTVLVREEGEAGPSWIDHEYRDGQVIVSPLLPGFGMPVEALWADVDADEAGPPE